MANNPYWDGKVHKAVKFGDRFDSRTVEGRKRAMRRAIQARRAKAEIELLREGDPGRSRSGSSACSGVAEAGSISSGLSFFTLPTALSTFHAVILSAS
jgi:hypothetical protein